jgi:hypothetical protein
LMAALWTLAVSQSFLKKKKKYYTSNI